MRLILWLAVPILSGCTIFQKKSEENFNSEPETIVQFDLKSIKTRGKLIAILDNSSTSYFIYKGQPMGYEHDLLQRYCKEIGVELQIKTTRSIDESIRMLNTGEGDLIAYFLTVTKERKERVDFTSNFITTRQVLIQKKPEGWRKMWSKNVERSLIRNQVDLIGKEVTVRRSSSFIQRLHHLSEEVGGDIIVVEEEEEKETEDLIQEVLDGTIQYTVADEEIALINSAYYPDLDVETPLSFPQQIAWAIRKTSPELKQSIDEWIREIKKTSFHQVVYNKYFKADRAIVERALSDYSSINGTSISEYDDLFKKYAQEIGWDWMMIASLSYQESRFIPSATSWVGARGLMQVMPNTGKRFGATNLFIPEQNVRAGSAFLKYLDERWTDVIADSVERQKFILASYNAGMGHVQDAVALAQELGYDAKKWDGNVEKAMRLKSKPAYFQRESVKFGYCRGESVVAYVADILNRYEAYQNAYSEKENSAL